MNSSNRLLRLVGIGAVFWSIWLSQNDVIFNKTHIASYMQVIFRGTHWARSWSIFQKEDKWKVLQTACRLIETLAMEIFAKYEWWFSNRLSL
jgi:hypothetical protein